MPFPEGMGDLRIRGAKRVRLVGEDPDPLDEVELPPRSGPALTYKPPAETPRGSRARANLFGSLRARVTYVDADEPDLSIIAKPHRRLPFSELKANLKPQQRGGTHFLSSTNVFGLSSRAEQNYPELFRPISGQYWKPLTEAERLELIIRQASALELVTHRDDADMVIAETAADQAYAEAQSRRNAGMRRRKSKKRGYEGKKEEEEWRRTAPLVRRYVEPQIRYRERTAIVRSGPLDTPILVTGLPTVQEPETQTMAQNAPVYGAPGKTRRGRRTRKDASAFDYSEPEPVKRELPQFETRGAPKIKISSWSNPYGLTPKAITNYPEAYREVSSVYWRQLSQEQREQIMQVQASAMEKVGFERGTFKQFIQDFEPGYADPHSEMMAALARSGAQEPSLGHKVASTITSTLLSIAILLIVAGIAAVVVIAIWDWLMSFPGM